VISALFVATNGPYFGIPDVDPWDIQKNAKNYVGSNLVIAHPPCERWGRYARGGPNPRARRFEIGDDGGCFESALKNVRRCGGVLEHPAGSHAFTRFQIPKPPRSGWSSPDSFGGRSCQIDQGNYGHKAKKATWLYAILAVFPELDWSKAQNKMKLEDGFHSKSEARRIRTSAGYQPIKRLSKIERIHTPTAFRDLLLSLVRP
jgi:hypothetical protein